MAQAVLMVVLSQPLLTSGFFKLVALGNEHVWDEPRLASTATLGELRGKIALVRRFFRMFRFLESFRAAHAIYTSFYAPPPPPPPPPPPSAAPEAAAVPSPPAAASLEGPSEKEEKDTTTTGIEPTPPTPAHHEHGPHCRHHQPQPPPGRASNNRPPSEAWLDIFSRTFNGMYLLLETLTLVDALQLPGLPLWGAARAGRLHVEGQRFWFLALLCGAAAGLLKVVKLVGYGPVPQTGEGYGLGPPPGAGEGEKSGEQLQLPDWQRRRDKMRRMVYARRESRRAWKMEIRTRGYALARRCVADVLDLAVPGSVVGWVRVEPGTVGAVMVLSTWLTGVEVWERCGREIGREIGRVY